MATDLFSTVELYRRIVHTAGHVLAKGAAFAESQGVSSDAMLDWRLVDDMNPLRFQIGVVCNFTKQYAARVAGLTVPESVDDGMDLAGFQAALAETDAFLAALTPEQFAGRDDEPLTVALGNGMEPTLPAARWLTVFAATNLYFHLTTAYDILRARGAPLGKLDMFMPDGL